MLKKLRYVGNRSRTYKTGLQLAIRFMQIEDVQRLQDVQLDKTPVENIS